jgi:Tol biopolymer transport system component
MGKPINAPGKQQYWPAVSPDGKFLFFGSNRDGNSDIYGVGTAVIERLRN